MQGPASDIRSVSRILYGVAAVTVIPLGHSLLHGSSDLPGGLARRAGTHAPCGATPSLFGLAPCGVCRASRITARAVRSYRTLSPLPRPLTAEAVCSLLRFPSNGLEPAIPDVIRHTALWSSDFPLSSCEDSDHPICYQHSYYRWFVGPLDSRCAKAGVYKNCLFQVEGPRWVWS